MNIETLKKKHASGSREELKMVKNYLLQCPMIPTKHHGLQKPGPKTDLYLASMY